MNNEERILSMLESLTNTIETVVQGQIETNNRLDRFETETNNRLGRLETDIIDLKVGQAELRASQVEIIHDVKAIWGQTERLTEFEAEICLKVSQLITVTKDNTYDIAILKHKAG